jgi:uncharacterized phage-associated protein
MRYPNLCKTLETLIDHCESIDGRTRVLKLVYLADKAWYDDHGKIYTEARYYRWNHGPFAREVLQALEWMDGVEVIQREVPGHQGPSYAYQSGERSRLSQIELAPEFARILLSVAEKWRRRSLQELLRHVYSDKAFSSTSFGEPLLAG